MTANPAGFHGFRGRQPLLTVLTAFPEGHEQAPAPRPGREPAPLLGEDGGVRARRGGVGQARGGGTPNNLQRCCRSAASSHDEVLRRRLRRQPAPRQSSPALPGKRVRWKLHTLIESQDIDDHVQDVFVQLDEQVAARQGRAPARFLHQDLVPGSPHGAFGDVAIPGRRRGRLPASSRGHKCRSTTKARAGGACEPPGSILDKLTPSSRRMFVLRYVEARADRKWRAGANPRWRPRG